MSILYRKVFKKQDESTNVENKMDESEETLSDYSFRVVFKKKKKKARKKKVRVTCLCVYSTIKILIAQ